MIAQAGLDQADAIKDRRVSSVELVLDAIKRIEQHDRMVNAVVTRDFDRALSAAADADSKVSKGLAVGAFHGVPMTVKECFHLAGMTTTFGKTEFANNIAIEDAESVKRMKHAGAIVLGKTNVPTDLADCQTYNRLYGTTANPHNLERTPGGSSGGAAAALAAGYVAIELGSDLAGSIRTPSHFCGVFGHKSSYGVIPQTGHSLLNGPRFDADLAVIGPMARTARDLTQAFEVLTTPASSVDPWKLELPRFERQSLREFRIGVIDNHPACPVSHETRKSIDDLVERLAAEGSSIVKSPAIGIDLQAAHRDFMVMYRSVGLSNMPEQQRIQLANEVSCFDIQDASFAASTRRAAALRHIDWLALANMREILRLKWKEFFRTIDVLICPAHSTTAFPHDHSEPREGRIIDVDGGAQPYNSYLFWVGIAGLCGLPSTVVPLSRDGDGLPIGVQLIGNRYNDYLTLAFAELLEKAGISRCVTAKLS